MSKLEIKNDDSFGFVFDMDGVIFDTEVIGLEVWQILADKYSLGNVREVGMKCIGRSTVDTMKIFTDAYGDKVDIKQMYAESRKVLADIIEQRGLPLKNGAVELLKFLKDKGVKVGLASSTSYNGVIKNLERAGLYDYFNVIVGGDMVEHSKPDPEIYLLACEKLNIDPKISYAVEDSKNGIISAFKAHMKPVLVPDLIEPTNEMMEMAYKKYSDLTQLLNDLS